MHLSSDDSHDFGYGLRREFWHRGILSGAARAFVEERKQSGLAFITATHDVKNPRSGGVMHNIGMAYQYTYEELVQPKNQLVTFRMYQCNLDGNNSRIYRKYWDASGVHFIEHL